MHVKSLLVGMNLQKNNPQLCGSPHLYSVYQLIVFGFTVCNLTVLVHSVLVLFQDTEGSCFQWKSFAKAERYLNSNKRRPEKVRATSWLAA